MSAIPQSGPRLLTAEEYAGLPDDGCRTELVRGRIVYLNMPMPTHGYICARIVRLVGNYVDDHDLGRVFSNDSGIITERHPDSVRGADVAFYSYNRLPRGPLPDAYPPLAPEVVFEVKSPSDSVKQMTVKAGEYLDAGVLQVCLVDPSIQRVSVLSVNAEPFSLKEKELLTFPGTIPGLEIPILKIFL
ncbi:MAG: Uma2 family endonuclease [Phycisphaeraceae bacterium]